MEDKLDKLIRITNGLDILLAYLRNGVNIDTDIQIVTGKKNYENTVDKGTRPTFPASAARVVISPDARLLLEFQKEKLTIPTFLAAGPRAQLHHDPSQIRAAIVVAGGIVPGMNNLIDSIVERQITYLRDRQGNGRIFSIRNGFVGLYNFADNTWDWLDKGESMSGRVPYSDDKEELDKATLSSILENYRIDILYVIGGNESLKVAHQLAQMNPTRSIVGIPATVDEAVPWVEKSIGFSTVVEQATHVIETLTTTARDTGRICLIELVGTESSLVTMTAAIATGRGIPTAILLPENFNLLEPENARSVIDKAVRYIQSVVQELKDDAYAVVVVAEAVGKALETRGIPVDSSGKLNESFIDQFSRILASQVSDIHRHPMSVFLSQPRDDILHASPNVEDRIYGANLGRLAVDSAMAGYTDFMITQWLDSYVLVPLNLVVEKVMVDLATKERPKPEARINAELLDSQTLRIRFPMPGSLNIEDLTKNIDEKLNAVEIIYSLFAILDSGRTEVIESFLLRLREPDVLAKVRATSFHQFLTALSREPLRIVAMHYGSPVSIDLLGIGKVLEVIRDIIKDVAWRGKYEKELAEVERKGKQTEIVTTRLEHEKTSIELAAQRIQLDKIKLENEKLQLDVIAQKIEIIQKALALPLTDDDKNSLVSVLTSQIATITSSPGIGRLKG